MKDRIGGLLITKINFLSGRIFSKIINKKSNLYVNNSQARILFVLTKFKELNINKLGEELSLSKSTLTSMLDRLEKLGYIRKRMNHLDRRETLINITEDGEKITQTYNSIVYEMSAVYYKGFSEEQIYEFEKYLEKIYINLKNFHENKEK
ncbi:MULTISPECIES: MarR family winged helix-turn-helix transcriptional regulator [Clostridium]|uniref:MarR family winged helix-turn-helix transcriptional regulator n=1 Tax=Clostridium TaxID=1485 RepID=UPI00024BB165|nr:MarR family transcriptional regulator [Clostridium sporogenes]STC73940.1 MarR family transcriptional regulator [Clostridium botulinum]EHN15244.1 hypothetical protein IYC_10239 [Clostridium sporogenes PA 3679]MCW6084420.1 MarR family transcriptional regulator [Clostridium sporogenes]MCW6105906.1 MarR family transcriptional regulator [Clostridium sporogenes]MDU4596514.1 MarR family transcriptional regulator [Clostridium sporogenes]